MSDIEEQKLLQKTDRISPWAIGFAIIAIVGIVAVIIAVAVTMFLGSSSDPAEKALAKTSLQHVIAATEVYRNENDDVYEGLTAAKIKKSFSETVIDGMPKPKQVGIMDYNSDQLVLIYLGRSGREYKAIVKSGSIEWDF